MPSIIQTVHFADDQRRDTDDFYNADGSLRRCTTARFQSLNIMYRGIHFAVVKRRDFSLVIYRGIHSPLYSGKISVSLLYRGIYFEISVSFIYRGIYLAVVQRRGFDL